MKISLKKFILLVTFSASVSYGIAQVPSNDEPCTAIVLPVASTCTFTTYTNANATGSSDPDPGCANYLGGDVWFKVKVPASGHLIFDTDAGVVDDGGMAVYSGNCSNLTFLDCNDDGSGTSSTMPKIDLCYLTAGDTLWVRFWEYNNNNNGTFGICIYDGGSCPVTPSNDNPCNAMVLPVANSCSYTISNNANALSSLGVPAPGCANYNGGDVWFKVKVPTSGHIVIDTDTMQIEDGGLAVYAGTCTSLVLVDCNDDASTNGSMPLIDNNLLSAGDTVWVRFWEFGNDNNGTFKICVWDGIYTSNSNNNFNIGVSIYPNPFTESTTLTITGGQMGNHELQLFNVFGQEVHPEIVRTSSGFVLQKGNDIQSGIYMYHIIMNGTHIHTGKLVVQ